MRKGNGALGKGTSLKMDAFFVDILVPRIARSSLADALRS